MRFLPLHILEVIMILIVFQTPANPVLWVLLVLGLLFVNVKVPVETARNTITLKVQKYALVLFLIKRANCPFMHYLS